MDPLSDVLRLLRPQSYVSRGFTLKGDTAIQWPQHEGIKCYAVLSGTCWLTVDGLPGSLALHAGDCFLLLRGLPFCLASAPGLTPVAFESIRAEWAAQGYPSGDGIGGPYLAGGHFVLQGEHAEILLGALPPVVHIRSETDKAAMRWALERMREELLQAQPGSSLMVQQIATMMLVQAIRLHLLEGATKQTGWLFALADRQMRDALECIHDDPGHPWTLQTLAAKAGMSRSVFAQRFRQTVGTTPMEYLTRWRMLLAGERLRDSPEPVAVIAASLGYESDSAFGKAFRKVMGTSPKRFSRTAQPANMQSSSAQ